MVNTFNLGKVKHHFVKVGLESNHLDWLDTVYVSIYGKNKFLFLYENINTPIQEIANATANLWNSLQFSLCQDILIIEDSDLAFNFLSELITDYYIDGVLKTNLESGRAYLNLRGIERKFNP